MAREIEGVYEHGTLKLARELPLKDGQRLTITLHRTGAAVARYCASIQWKGSWEELECYLNDPDEGQWGSRDI